MADGRLECSLDAATSTSGWNAGNRRDRQKRGWTLRELLLQEVAWKTRCSRAYCRHQCRVGACRLRSVSSESATGHNGLLKKAPVSLAPCHSYALGDKIALGIRERHGQLARPELGLFHCQFNDLFPHVIADAVPHTVRPGGAVMQGLRTAAAILNVKTR